MAFLYRRWYLQRHRQIATDGWQRIYEHLENRAVRESNETQDEPQGESNENEDAISTIQYKNLSIEVPGKISVDEDEVIQTAAKWEVSV